MEWALGGGVAVLLHNNDRQGLFSAAALLRLWFYYAARRLIARPLFVRSSVSFTVQWSADRIDAAELRR